MSVRTWPEATEGRNPMICAQCCQPAQAAVTRLQLSAVRVHAPSDSHNLDTDCGGGLTIPPLPGAASNTIWRLATKFWAGFIPGWLAGSGRKWNNGNGLTVLILSGNSGYCTLTLPGSGRPTWGPTGNGFLMTWVTKRKGRAIKSRGS